MIKILDDLVGKWTASKFANREKCCHLDCAEELRAAIPVVEELIKASEEAMRLEFLAVLIPPSYPGETRTLPQSNGALVRHDAKIKAQQKELVEALIASEHALRSYQYGNSATDLAEECADYCTKVLARVKGA